MLGTKGVTYAGQHIGDGIGNDSHLNPLVLPTRFSYAGDLPCAGVFAEANTTHLKLAQKTARPPAQWAPIVSTGRKLRLFQCFGF
jgi:hypothetical protein